MKLLVPSFLWSSHILLSTLFCNNSKLCFTSRELIMTSSTSQHGGLVICLKTRWIFSRRQQMAYETLLASGGSVFKQDVTGIRWQCVQTSCLNCVFTFAIRFEWGGESTVFPIQRHKQRSVITLDLQSSVLYTPTNAPPDLAFKHSL